MEKPMNSQRLSKTDSIQELANFWDTHDVTEFEDELEEVGERVFERETDITVRLETAAAKAVREMAKSRGVGEAELIREWVLERIHAT
jgi:predicted DNA binding CopG/RHH family protein